ncbi:MAG: T9SS type A sorting domain-containing protein [Ignavibacteria bacterium]|nr:T9SS type A sorting domain-containing protein [Ignavibacteria bacterium]
MKKKYIVIVIPVVFLITAFIIFTPQNQPLQLQSSQQISTTVEGWDKFYTGAFDNYYTATNIHSNLNYLGFTTWHKYVEKQSNNVSDTNWYFPFLRWDGSLIADSLKADITDYASGVRSRIQNIYNNSGSNERKLIIMRPKITWLCYGQRSDYQCENKSHVDSDLWFYTFQSPDSVGTDIIDNSSFGSGQYVKYCHNAKQTDAGSSWVVSRLRANAEQTSETDAGNPFMGDSKQPWRVKPRIRVDTTFVNDTSNASTIICRVEVINHANQLWHAFDIKARNFKVNRATKYSGNYLEEFYFQTADWTDTSNQIFKGNIGVAGESYGYGARGDETSDPINHKGDIRVFWTGVCDMWIDYIRVDNETAHQLFKGTYDTLWIKNEVDQIADPSLYGGIQTIKKFYIELAEFNNIPCIGYVNEKLKYYSGLKGFQIDVMQDLTNTISASVVPWSDRTTVENAGFLYRQYMQKGGFEQIFMESYPLTACFTKTPSQQLFSKIPNTLPYTSGDSILGKAESPEVYDEWLQNKLDSVPYQLEYGGFEGLQCSRYGCGGDTGTTGADRGNFRFRMQLGNEISRLSGKPFIFMPQLHQWFRPYEVRREPTNEELNMMANLAVSYGVKGLLYFWYSSYHDALSCQYGKGIANENDVLIDSNYYHQPDKKKDIIKAIVERTANKWGPYLMSFNSEYTHSYIYKSEKSSMASNTFINDIRTDTSGYIDSVSNRYVQAAVFKNDSAYKQYFMIVNKRCSPLKASNPDGRRNIKVQFHANDSRFSYFNNWKIIDLENNSTVLTFDKSTSAFLDLGIFNPGQGKLYKLIPVMIDGGVFVTNEYLSNLSFNCNGTVNTNGYNLTLAEGVNISFANNIQIKMKKGTFASGNAVLYPKTCNLKAKSEAEWNGIEFDSTDVRMSYTTIKGTKKDASNTGYALNFIDCDTVIVNKTYITTTDSSGCINMYYHSGAVTNPLVSLTYDSLNVNIAGNPPLSMYSISSLSGNFKAEHNVIKNFYSSGGGTGVTITGFINFLFNDNFFRSFARAFYSVHSSPDFWANTFNNGAYGDFAYNILGEYTTFFDFSSNAGGYNTVTNFSGECVKLDASYVDIHNGGNYFNVYDTLGYHLRGYFPDTVSNTNQDGRGNCFVSRDIVRDSAHVRINVTLANSTPVNYRLLPFAAGCNPADNVKVEQKEMTIQSLNEKDKTTKDQKAVKNDLINTLKSDDVNNENKSDLSRILYEEMKKALKNEDYKAAKEKSLAILALGVENMYSIDAVRKLFHCVVFSKNDKSETVSEKVISQSSKKDALSKNPFKPDVFKNDGKHNVTNMGELKSYYETYIQNHPSNNVIISEMFYFIQKCKINLGEYESALNGYKAIMEKNPNSMAGLNAKWEYSDLQLLISSRGNKGTGGGENNVTGIVNLDELNPEQQYERLANLIEDPKDGKDKPDTKKKSDEDKKTITNNIIKSLDANGQKDENMVKFLEEKINSNQASTEEVKEYRKRLLYKELIKIEKVSNTLEQIAMIQNDLRRLFELDKSADNPVRSKEPSVIAYDYKLNQNYPNPFNPSTRISYEIKNAGFVSLKIYDLLGREIAELVNETKEAGRYMIDFNAAKYSLASGIYFYRIKAGDFIDTKRMVLVK